MLESKFLSGMDNILDPNETILWSGKPDRRPFILSAMGGIPIGLALLGFTTIWLIAGEPLLESPAIISIPVAILFIVVIPAWQIRKIPNAEYMITNQRLIIKSGITKQDAWFAELDDIKDVIIKIGFADKLFGTGRIYPITPENPFDTSRHPFSFESFSKTNMNKAYNIVKQQWEKVNEGERFGYRHHHPHLQGLKEPYAVQKLLKEAISGAGTNYVSCEYCNYRYDLNKAGKCPHCGAPKSLKYSIP